VTWEDRGFETTTYCRDCLEDDRNLWRDLPHGTSALIYDGPVRCSSCNRDIPALATSRPPTAGQNRTAVS
jgi:hypothetical protein